MGWSVCTCISPQTKNLYWKIRRNFYASFHLCVELTLSFQIRQSATPDGLTHKDKIGRSENQCTQSDYSMTDTAHSRDTILQPTRTSANSASAQSKIVLSIWDAVCISVIRIVPKYVQCESYAFLYVKLFLLRSFCANAEWATQRENGGGWWSKIGPMISSKMYSRPSWFNLKPQGVAVDS